MIDLTPFLLVPILATLVFFGYYQWLKRLRERIILRIHTNNKNVRELRIRLISIRSVFKDFEPYRSEPYIFLTENLGRVILTLGYQYTNISREQRQIWQDLPKSKSNQIKSFLIFIFNGKLDWNKIQASEDNLENHLNEIYSRATKAENFINELHKQPEKTALRVKKIIARVDEIKVGITKLVTNNVWGDMLDDGKNRYKSIALELEKIPANYYIGFQNKFHSLVLATICVFQVLGSVEKSSDELLKDFRKWDDLFNNGSSALSKGDDLFGEIQKCMSSMPVPVDVTRTKTRIDELFVQLIRLRKEFQKPSLENVPGITLQANQVIEEGITLLSALKSYAVQYEKFSDLSSRIFTRIQSLQSGFNSQISQVKYPLRWDLSQEKIEPLTQEWESIEPPSVLRVPEKITKDFDKLIQVDTKLVELEKVYTTIIQQAKKLREGWYNIKRIVEPEWMQKIDELDRKIAPYSPENWDTKLQVSTIKVDALQLIQRVEQNIQKGENFIIFESKLPGLLAIIQILIKDIDQFVEKQKTIESRYGILIEKELSGSQKIKTTLPWVHAIINEINKWDLPTNRVKDIYEIDNQGETLKSELSQREVGKVEIKFQKIEKWAKSANEKISFLVSSLTQEVKTVQEEILSKLEELDQIGKVKDKDVNIAREFVTTPTYYLDVSIVRLNSDQSYEKIRQLLLMRRDLYLCQVNLVDTVKPLIDIAYDVELYREKAHAILEKAENQMTRDWPPIIEDVIPEHERKILASAEDDMNFYRNRKLTISDLDLEYRRIRDKYKSVILGVDEKIRRDGAQKHHYDLLDNSIKSRLRARIQEQATLIPGFSLSLQEFEFLEKRGKAIVSEIRNDFINNKIDSIEVENLLANIFQPYNTKIDLNNLNVINTEGGPAFMEPVINSGYIGGRTDSTRIN
jgi:hypothetical protein